MSITLEVNELLPPQYTYYIKVRCFLDNSGNHEIEPILSWLENQKFMVLKYTWTSKTGEYSGEKNRLHWHLHMVTKRYEEWNEKTPKGKPAPPGQRFKDWWKGKGIPYACRSLCIQFEKELKKDEDMLLQYPLKEQKCLTEEMYHGMSRKDAEKLYNFSQAILKEENFRKKQKEEKEEHKVNTWNQLVAFLKCECETNPLWQCLIQETLDEPDNLGKIPFSKIKRAFNILGPYVVRYYMKYEDCNIPYKIDMKLVKYVLQQNLVSPEDIYFFLS